MPEISRVKERVMKKSFQRLFVITALVFLAGMASAQTGTSTADSTDLSSLSAGNGRQGKAMANKARYDSLKKSLNLTPAQSAGMDSVNLLFKTGLAQLKAEGGDKRSKFKEAKKLKESRESGLKSILSPDQYDRLKQYEAQVKDERRSSRKGLQ